MKLTKIDILKNSKGDWTASNTVILLLLIKNQSFTAVLLK